MDLENRKKLDPVYGLADALRTNME
jgi:hypothetical protein